MVGTPGRRTGRFRLLPGHGRTDGGHGRYARAAPGRVPAGPAHRCRRAGMRRYLRQPFSSPARAPADCAAEGRAVAPLRREEVPAVTTPESGIESVGSVG